MSFKCAKYQEPNGAANTAIESAVLELYVDEVETGTVTAQVKGEPTDTGAFNDTYGQLKSRARTTSSANWNIGGSGAASGTKVTSTDISPVIQEIVSHGNWATSKAITLFFTRASGTGSRTFQSFEGVPTQSAKLKITYRN